MTVDRVDSVEWSVLGWVSAGVGRCWDGSVPGLFTSTFGFWIKGFFWITPFWIRKVPVTAAARFIRGENKPPSVASGVLSAVPG